MDAIEKYTGIDVQAMDTNALRATAQQLKVPIEDEDTSKADVLDALFTSQCEPHLIQPTFIIDHPVEMSPLAKQHAHRPSTVERFELICNGKELCNAYSELNDPVEQEKRFRERHEPQKGDNMVIDHDFLQALGYGMPPTFGWGLGVDRLTMLVTNNTSIQDVILFPQMRSKQLSAQA